MGKLTFLLMVIILIIVVPLVLRQGYRVAKKSGQVTEYWGWFGGFMVFYCPGNTRYAVIKTLNTFGGVVRDYSFTKYGLTTWSI